MRTPIAIALMALSFGASAQQTTASSNDRNNLPSQGQQGGATFAPPSFTALRDRINSPVEVITLNADRGEFPADGQSSINLKITLLGQGERPVSEPQEVTLEVTNGARILVPGRMTSEAGADKADVDRIVPATQLKSKNGEINVKILAPAQPGDVLVRASIKGRQVDLKLTALPDERDMFVVGLIELQGRGDRVDAKELVAARQNDGFDQELRRWRREFGNGKTSIAGRGALYLKGLIKGDVLMTLAYDSEKQDTKTLFQDIDPQALYAVYGDSSVKGIDAQSSSKLYVRLDKKRNYLLYGDYNSSNGGASLATYSRSLTGVKGHLEEGPVTANAWVSRDSLRQVIDEFPARGVSGPYSLTNPNGVQGTEKVELVVRDRSQPAIIKRITQLSRFTDYEFEPFDGKIVFKAPVPSVDDQSNPISIRVTYEVEQSGKNFTVAGVDGKLKVNDTLAISGSFAKDNNPSAPYTLSGIGAEVNFTDKLKLTAELAKSKGTPSAGLGSINAATPVDTGVSGNAAKVELQHNGEDLRARGYYARAQDGFNNTASGLTGGRTEAGLQGALKLTDSLNLKGEVIKSKDSGTGITATTATQTNRDATGAQLGLEYKPSDTSSVEVGIRRAKQNAQSLLANTLSGCSNGSTPNTTGYNAGFGISQTGAQQLDPNTGLPIVCSGSTLAAQNTNQAQDTTNNAIYVRGKVAITERTSAFAEVQRDKADTTTATGTTSNTQTLYGVGLEYRPYDKTRVYLRHDFSRSFGGLYGLGEGDGARLTTLGVDSEYLPDANVFSEYRLRDAANGKEVQNAIGLRNGWMLAEGLKLLTNAEQLRSRGNPNSTPPTPNNTTTALGLGLEYTASPLWKASGRVEWRQDATNVNWLSTVGIAGKLNRDWTILARNYLNRLKPRNESGAHIQDRFQIGAAYRPVDSNDFDALGLLERRIDKDTTLAGATNGIQREANIISTRLNWHPSRPWWVSGRVAAKQVRGEVLNNGVVQPPYTASLAGMRVTYDITNRWSVGTNVNYMIGSGGTKQYAYGLEGGYTVFDNLLVVLGYTWRGFSDRDLLSAENYTNRGWYLGLRYKFDEDLFGRFDPKINKTLVPPEAETEQKK